MVEYISSYNVEQSKGDTQDMIVIAMRKQGLDLQSAADCVGDFCKHNITCFLLLQENLPSWGPELDWQADIYIGGLADWITGNLK